MICSYTESQIYRDGYQIQKKLDSVYLMCIIKS